MGAGRDRSADLVKMLLHGRGIAPGHDQAGAFAFRRADGAEDISRDGALVVRCAGTRAAPGPTAGQLVLLPDAGLILEPELDLDTGSALVLDGRQRGGKVFLNACIATASWA
jgi:hypothetical protein